MKTGLQDLEYIEFLLKKLLLSLEEDELDKI
jgi:hypothetical protein